MPRKATKKTTQKARGGVARQEELYLADINSFGTISVWQDHATGGVRIEVGPPEWAPAHAQAAYENARFRNETRPAPGRKRLAKKKVAKRSTIR